jgi:hypothetical protein
MLAIESTVRIGWDLLDLRTQFKGVSDMFEKYVDENLPMHHRTAYKYIKSAKQFQRDRINLMRCAEIKSHTSSLLEVEEAPDLLRQIFAVNANTNADLLRVAGVSKAKAEIRDTNAADMIVGDGRRSPEFFRMFKSLTMTITRIHRATKRVPVESWDNDQKRAVMHELRPYVDLFNSLEGAPA